MITLAEHQFELLPTELSTAGVGFGIGLDVSIDQEGWDPGDAEWQVQDSLNEQRGTRNFGRDVLAGPTHTFAAFVDQDDVDTAVAALETLRTAWLAPAIRDTPGLMSIMRYRLAGRNRLFYGRPRKFASPPSNRILNGYIPITMTFDTVNALFYEDLASTTTIPYATTSDGGVTFPLTFPVSSLPSGQREGSVYIGGSVATYPVIRFNGPIQNPYLTCGSAWTVQLNMTIASGQYVEVDARPWKMTVLRNGLYSEAGSLTRRTRFKDLVLNPGPQEFAFGGTDLGGAPTCTVTWRGAYASL